LQQSAELGRQQPTADSHIEQQAVEAQPTAAGFDGQSTPDTDAPVGENLPPSILSSRWPGTQSSADLDRERGLARSAATDARIDSQDRMPPVSTRDHAATEISVDRVLLALLVGALVLTVATGGLIFKYSTARRLRRGDVLDRRGLAWEWTQRSHTFSASDVSTRQANVVCDPHEPRELSCVTEELRQLLVQLVESGTFSRWPPISRRDVDPSFSYSPGDAGGSLGPGKSAVRAQHRHVRRRASQ
jgi:hypothetical protein